MDGGAPLKVLAAEAGIRLRTADTWLPRFRSGGHTSLADQRSVRRWLRRTLDPQLLQHALNLRHQRCTLRLIATAVHTPLSTMERAMQTLGLGRLRNLTPRAGASAKQWAPLQRYPWQKPGNLIHVDTQPQASA